MCGICGFNWYDKNLIRKMTRALIHRGPDDRGYYTDTDISLGMRRLSIIDLKKGIYPITNENGTLFLVFNGEIYNYKELTRTLQNNGHKFKTNCDGEVIVHAYEQYGYDCVKYFNGMFAFALWDAEKKQLLLARDRFGIKPLYYYWDKKRFIFGSEIKAILKHEIERRVSRSALSTYLVFRCALFEQSFFNKIKRLLPAHILIYKGNKIQTLKYWSLEKKTTNSGTNKQAKELISILTDAVKKRLMSDVPIGVYLSGGIDSSTIVALMSQSFSGEISTFSVGFGSKEHDELAKARFISKHFNTKHHEIIVKPDSYKYLPQIVNYLDEPLADPTVVPTFFLSEKTKKNATVVLTGEGADETFAGYIQYKIMKFNKFPLNAIAKGIIAKAPRSLLNKSFKYTIALGAQGINRALNAFSESRAFNKYLQIISIFNKYEASQILGKKISFNNIAKHLTTNKLNSLLVFDINTTLPEDLLMKVDKMTMAHSIEARVPFLDHRLVEFSFSLPEQLKLRGFQDKYLLRRAMGPYLPKKTTKTKKNRFFVPIDEWFYGELGDILKNMVSEKNIKKQGYFNYNYINKMFKQYPHSPLFYARQLWSLLIFQLWHKIYIDQEKVEW